MGAKKKTTAATTKAKPAAEKVAMPVVAGQPVRVQYAGTHRMGSVQSMTLDEAWEKLTPGFRDVFRLTFQGQEDKMKFPYMDYYTIVYNFCTSVTKENGSNYGVGSGDFATRSCSTLSPDGAPAKLSGKITQFVRQHLTDVFQADMQSRCGNDLLTQYCRKWENFRFSAKVVHGFCIYLNEHFLRRKSEFREQEIYPVYGVCLKEWRDGAVAAVQDQVLRAVAEVITADRNGDITSSFMVRTVVDCLVDLGLTLDFSAQGGTPSPHNAKKKEKDPNQGLQVYQKYLEAPFLADTRVYYDNESRVFLANNSVANYVVKVQSRLKEEEDRCMKYLHASTCSKLIKTVEDVMITQQMVRLRAEFMIYLAGEKVEDLKAMYALISRVPQCMDELYNAVQTHIRQKGLEALAKNPTAMTEDPRLYLDAILEVYDQCDPLITESFRGEKEFRTAFDKGFHEFVNDNAITQLAKTSKKSSEQFARYCDVMLKKGAKNLSELDLENTLTRFMIAFKYIDDKDVFQRYYQQCLCRRLISSLSASDDAEASMITKLKAVAGWEYVTKLQRMFQDITLSTEMKNSFKSHDPSRRNDWKFEFHVQVLASGAWPLNPGSMGLQPPVELERPLTVFNEFYTNKFSGRKLTWVYPNSRCEIATNCYKVKRFLMVSATQAAIILQFNDRDVITYGEIRDAVSGKMSLPDESLFKQILVLLLKSHLLMINDENEKVDEKDITSNDLEIKLNLNFKPKTVRVNLNQQIRAEQKQNEDTANKGIEDDRTATIQAAIVRTMKMRKEMRHQALIGETLDQLSRLFKPNVAAVKKNIETLIEKEYIKRSEEERDLYTYVA
ncbi:Cullin-1 [Hypsibius exemplaris]|uniref:Cullin-1 n=1 Tax=Hypsibius exemplaris TaxID=2072580 RepID=A0A1W0XCN1_HYPEX|nr:Cullin-1 [Hypsibius exemplaris]